MADSDEAKMEGALSDQATNLELVSVTDPSQLSAETEELLRNLDTDPYDEDQAELRFLHSKPTCFIVLGKPGSGKTLLAKRLAQEWRCEHINATEVIQQAVEMQTEMGQKVLEILLRGEAVPEDVTAKMIEEKINSQEVAHHGYVLDGFPSLSEDYMSIKDQLELVKNWKLKPDFIVNLKIPDYDLEARRVGQRVDPMTGEIFTKEIYDPDKSKPSDRGGEEGEEEEEEAEEEMEEEEEELGLPAEVLERLVKRPEDLPTHVQENIKNYKGNMLRILEDYMADHDQQYLIELDTNKNINIIFKELLTRLSCFVLRPAAVPVRLLDLEEDDIPEDTETEDLMRQLAPKQMVAPRYRWRRSRWLRNCPVALAEGNLSQGKPEFAVSFLDKIYCMSNEEAMAKFMKNPRPYLLPPQPRPPIKLVVTGPPLSGKTTTCHLLAQKYGAKVLNMDEFILPKIEEERQKTLDALREEVTENAIITVRARLKEQWEQEQAQKEAALAAEREAREAEKLEEEENEDEDEEGKEDENETKDDGNGEEEAKDHGKGDEEEDKKNSLDDSDVTHDEDQTTTDGATTDADTTAVTTTADDTMTTDKPGGTEGGATEMPQFEVDADHAEVKVIVDLAVNAAKDQDVALQPEVWIEVMEEAIKQHEQDLAQQAPDGPINGGWIFDNFPRTRDQWNAMIERGIIPDEVIVLKDESENGEFLLKRWYYVHGDEVNEKIRARQEQEAEAKRQKEEEERRRVKAERFAAEEAARIAQEEEKQRRLEDRQRRIDAGEVVSDEEGDGEGDGPTEPTAEQEDKAFSESSSKLALEAPEIRIDEPEDEEGEHGADSARTEETERSLDKDLLQADEAETPQPPEQDAETVTEKPAEAEIDLTTPPPPTPPGERMPPEGQELEAQKEIRKQWDIEWNSSMSVITGTSNLDPVSLELQHRPEEGATTTKTEEDILKEVTSALEKTLQYTGWELQGIDIDEEEEDADADAMEEEEEEAAEEEEEEDPNRAVKKQLGDVNFFCPVALQENHVLWPGNPETAAKYREKIYYCSSSEARDKFLADPTQYLPKDKPFVPPPIRLLILGPKGAGKSLHGRHLAKKLGVFHIQYRDRLQELIIAKTKKKIGPEYDEPPEEEDPEEEEEEDEEESAGILNPDGTKYEGEAGEEEKRDDTPKLDSKEDTMVSGGDDKEEEEEEQVEFTEDEESIVSYLKDDEPLPTELLDKIVGEWWTKEPFKSTGFILEGFPRTTEEAEYIGTAGLYPDAALLLAVEDTDVIARLLPPKLDKWKQKRDKKLAKKQRIKDKKQKKREAAIAKRRAELQKEQDERKAQRKVEAQLRAERLAEKEDNEDENSDEEVEEEEEEEEEGDNIDDILAEEFEEEEEEEEDDEETEEDATDRMRNELEEVYDNDTNRLSDVQNKLEDLLITRVELDAGRKAHIVRYVMTKRLRNIVQFRSSLFERVYPVKEHVALRMLKTGYKQPSRFGRWCPVLLSEGDVIQPMQGPGYQTFPCIYRSFIYFLSSAQAKEQFMQNPMLYLGQDSPKPVVPIRMAIIGPPKSGKTTLAKRFAEEFGLLRLSIGEAMRSLQELQPHTELAKTIHTHLCRGITVPDELAVQALEVALMDMRCQTRGFILDGYPMTKKQVDLMTARSIIPVRVIELKVEAIEIATRATKDRYSPDRVFPLHDSAQITAMKLAGWHKEAPEVREWYKTEHANWCELNGETSKWFIWDRVVDIAKCSVKQIQTYLQRTAEGKAASIADMCITPREFEVRLGDYQQYCPVRLSRGELIDCSVTPSLQYATEFRGHYYKCAGQKELEQFLSDPEKYVPPLAPNSLPPGALRPTRRSATYMKEKFPVQVEMQGYCPVTYLDGKQRYEAIIPGNPELVVEYRKKFYYMESEDKLQKFMRLPEEYWDLKLPHKLPPKKEPMPVTALPMLGYMEQTVSSAIIKAMTAAGNFKPKYPYLSPSRSALIYVAYHLKAYNPKSSDYIRRKYKRKLMDFEETCELINYLGDNMSRKFKEPKERPIDFDFKLEKFVQLRDIEPTGNWLV